MFFYGIYYSQPCQNTFVFPLQTLIQESNPVQHEIANSLEFQKQKIGSNNQLPINILQNQLIKKHKQSKSKLWTEEEDALLCQLAKSQLSWSEISSRFQGKCQLVCQRRYKRLIRQSNRWPKQSEQLIKYLYEVQKKSWRQIQKILPKYTKKQIKQRYKNFLEVDMKRANWTVEQDLELWNLVKNNGNSWVKFTKILTGRSQLQLKNRYNKFIKPLEMRLLFNRKVHSQTGSLNQESHL